MPSTAPPPSLRIDHYENFPVASWLCPAAIRPAVVSIYHFARTADDLADEGDAAASERLEALATYRSALVDALAAPDQPLGGNRWPEVFVPLAAQVAAHQLPATPLHDLLSAFEQDVRHTAAGHAYADTAELLAYCRCSANPVGRLLLHLYGIQDPVSLAQSDAVCSALQLINFWQDVSVDHARGRHYLPADALARHGLRLEDFSVKAAPETQVRCERVVAELCDQARSLMLEGAPLARRIPGRAGWELRLVVQGGLRILDKIAAIGHRSWLRRPAVGKADLPLLLWRALLGNNLSRRPPAD